MLKKLFLILILFALLISAPAGLAQDDEKPTVAILRFGESFDLLPTDIGIFEVLQANGIISSEEFTYWYATQFWEPNQLTALESENITILRRDPGEDFAAINLIVDNVLDQDVDAIVAISTPMTQAVINATWDMEDPPAVLFTAVYDPYAAGIAQSSCIKPDHITGVEIVAAYDEAIAVLLVQNPDIEVIGTIYSSSEITGREGVSKIVAAAEAQGLRVEQAAVTALRDLELAAEGLISKGAEAFVIPWDIITQKGIPILAQVANNSGIPIFHATTSSITFGVTAGVSSSFSYQRGVGVGHILAAWLNGEVDIATTAITVLSDTMVAVNKDTAEMLGIEIADELEDQAGIVVEAGKLQADPALYADEMPRFLIDMAKAGALDEQIDAEGNTMTRELVEYLKQMDYPPDLSEVGKEFVASLVCTPERIAQEQAELDAQSE